MFNFSPSAIDKLLPILDFAKRLHQNEAEPIAHCINWTGNFIQGNPVAYVNNEGNRDLMVRRLALEALLGRLLNKNEFARYTCGNKACVNPSHLGIGLRTGGERISIRVPDILIDRIKKSIDLSTLPATLRSSEATWKPNAIRVTLLRGLELAQANPEILREIEENHAATYSGADTSSYQIFAPAGTKEAIAHLGVKVRHPMRRTLQAGILALESDRDKSL